MTTTETSTTRSIRKLKGDLDFSDWQFEAQGRLTKRKLWHIIATPRPGRIRVPVTEADQNLEQRRADEATPDGGAPPTHGDADGHETAGMAGGRRTSKIFNRAQ